MNDIKYGVPAPAEVAGRTGKEILQAVSPARRWHRNPL